jgi:hypothetical protein
MSLFGNGWVQFAISSIYQEKELSLYATVFLRYEQNLEASPSTQMVIIDIMMKLANG